MEQVYLLHWFSLEQKVDWPGHFNACGVAELMAIDLSKIFSYIPILLSFPEIKDHKEIQLGISKC